MRPIGLALAMTVFTLPAHAETSPLETVKALFDAMRAGDGAAVMRLVSKDAPLARVQADGTVRPSTFEAWAAWVDQQAPGDADEQIFDVEVRQFGDLASVWAPFVLTYKGELAGCGVNQFTLARSDAKWTIIHGIDTQHDGDCATFRENYAAEHAGKSD